MRHYEAERKVQTSVSLRTRRLSHPDRNRTDDEPGEGPNRGVAWWPGPPAWRCISGVLGQVIQTSDVGKQLTDRQIEQGDAWHWG
jgi:hypothetical protein